MIFRPLPVIDTDDLVATHRRNGQRFENGAGVGAHRETAAVQIDQHAIGGGFDALGGHYPCGYPADLLLDNIARIFGLHKLDRRRQYHFHTHADYADIQGRGHFEGRCTGARLERVCRLLAHQRGSRQIKRGNVGRAILLKGRARGGRLLRCRLHWQNTKRDCASNGGQGFCFNAVH